MAKSYELNMTQGSIFKSVIRFAIPLILSSILQLLYNAADLVVVSRFAGSDAMASVGATTTVYNLIVNVFMGFSIGASIIVSRCFGARDRDGLHRGVHTAMTLSVIVGISAAIIGFFLARPVMILMNTPANVLDGAVLYLRIICLALPGTLVYNFGAAILRAVGDTKRPLYVLAATGVVNVILNLVLVIGFHLDVAGVAIATAVANYLSMFAIVYSLMHSHGEYRLVLKDLRLHKEELAQVVRLGLPAGLQGSVFSLANTVILSAVNGFGAEALKGNAAGGNIEGFVYVAMNAFYQATLTAVSQNYGARDEKRVNRSIWVPLLCVTVVGLTLGLLCTIFARPLLRIYITDSETALDYGAMRMVVTCAPYFLCGVMEVLTGAIRGLGSSTVSAVNSLIGACGFRVFWVFCILPFYPTLGFLYLCWPISWLVVIIMHTVTLLIVKKRAIQRMLAEE